MRKALLILLAFLVALGFKLSGFSATNLFIGPQEITPPELKAMMDDGDFVLLDVRTPLEYEQGHIPGAVLVPSYEVEKIEALGIPKDKKIVVYCAVDPRSTKSVGELSEMGYTNLLRLKGGVYEWRRADGVVVKSTSQEVIEPSSTKEAPSTVLVEVDWVEERVGDQGVKLIYLARDEREYTEGHIPSSIYMNPYSDIVDAGNPVDYMAISADGLEELLGGTGVGSEDNIVLYDDADNLFASRMYWILKYYGHEEVHVLDGGLEGWKGLDKEITAEAPAIEQVEYSVRVLDASILATKEYVLDNLENPDVSILDSRSMEKYEAGHIPGAVNVDWMLTVNEDGTFKSREELGEIYSFAGLTKDKLVITYCTNGYAGAVAWFELSELLHYPRVKLYDGSWEEWGSDPDMPVVTGGQPWAKAPETTVPPMTQPPQTTQPAWAPTTPAQLEPLELEVDLVLLEVEGGTTVEMWDSYTVQVGDALLRLAIDYDGCLGLTVWTFSVFEKMEDGAKYEGKVTYYSTDSPSTDISQGIHENSDALDDYSVVVDDWEWRGLKVIFNK